jgi:hypothetical protein
VAEQLVLQDLAREGAAVDGDERTLLPVDLSWMARATSSLPVPLSPTISMLALGGRAASMMP